MKDDDSIETELMVFLNTYNDVLDNQSFYFNRTPAHLIASGWSPFAGANIWWMLQNRLRTEIER